MPDLARLKYPKPEFVRKALTKRGWMENCNNCPSYQQNDYIGWIMRAKRVDTQLNT